MGFKQGEGLGQQNQGLVEPVEIKSNLGHRGLGHIINGLQSAKLTWDINQEVIIIVRFIHTNFDDIFSLQILEIEETIYWLESHTNINCKYIEQKKLTDWMKIVPKKLSISDETQYCDPILLQKVLKAKVCNLQTVYTYTGH